MMKPAVESKTWATNEKKKNENGLYFESLVIEVRFDYNYLMKLMPLWNLGLIGMPSGTNFQLSD